MNHPANASVVLCLGLLVGCATFEIQTPERIRAREPILFEGTAVFGRISADGDRITWQGRQPILITPTTLFAGTEPLSFATIESIVVGGFEDVGFGPFEPPRRHPDLLMVKETRGVFGGGCVLQLVPDETSTRAELASRLATLIESRRGTVDPFGRLDAPRRAWLGTGLARAPAGWAREPYFLEEHHPVKRKTLEALFREAGPSAAARFERSFRDGLPADAGGYTFAMLPDLAITRRGWLDPRSLKKATAGREPARDRLLVSDLTHFLLAEKIDPPAAVSISVTIRYYLDYYNLTPPQNGAAHWHERVVTAPLDEWLAGGTDRILAEVAHTGSTAAVQLRRELAPFSPAPTTPAP